MKEIVHYNKLFQWLMKFNESSDYDIDDHVKLKRKIRKCMKQL